MTEGPAPNGCEGMDRTVTFETVDVVQNMRKPDEPEVGDMLAAQFDQPWECGRGFSMSDADQDWAVAISVRAGDVTLAAGDTITLPSERFAVAVAFGVDLMAGNCEMEREPFSGASIMLAVWPVTEGTFVYPDATIICDGSSASTELVDAVVDTPDGPVELSPIEMVNPAFACGPGWDD